ncbi:MAG: type II toxin-antitoxin system HicA family toxin [Paramuribaculum sp.]|nr:type II toxin-antitoxin system HicA family toxin [Paramuribaculum sp.]
MKRYKVREIIEMLEADGWVHIKTQGSHRQFRHPVKKGRVTVNGSKSDVLSQFLLNSIFKQAGWK